MRQVTLGGRFCGYDCHGQFFFWLSAIFKIFVDKAFVQGSTDEIQTMLSNVGPTDHRRDAQRPATREAGRHDAAALFALVSVTKFHS